MNRAGTHTDVGRAMQGVGVAQVARAGAVAECGAVAGARILRQHRRLRFRFHRFLFAAIAVAMSFSWSVV